MRNLINSFFVMLFTLLFYSCSSKPPAPTKPSEIEELSKNREIPGKPQFRESIDATRFFKGNLHTHTSESDGNETTEKVVSWYEKNHYDFLAITDHDKLTNTNKWKTKSFLTIPGVEVTGLSKPRKKPIHVNALCGSKAHVGIRNDQEVSENLQSQINLAKTDGSIVLVNHPNFDWALPSDELLKTDGFELLEIATGHPIIEFRGNAEHASEEEIWDVYLTKKHRVFGVAVDDAHDYKVFKDDTANPGRGWIMAWASALNQESVCHAIRNGFFYSSLGSSIDALLVKDKTITINVKDWNNSRDRVDFIGQGGRLLQSSLTVPAKYELQGGEGYVRAHVFQERRPANKEAWTQAYYVIFK